MTNWEIGLWCGVIAIVCFAAGTAYGFFDLGGALNRWIYGHQLHRAGPDTVQRLEIRLRRKGLGFTWEVWSDGKLKTRSPMVILGLTKTLENALEWSLLRCRYGVPWEKLGHGDTLLAEAIENLERGEGGAE
jgi:hypothetical protein